MEHHLVKRWGTQDIIVKIQDVFMNIGTLINQQRDTTMTIPMEQSLKSKIAPIQKSQPTFAPAVKMQKK